MFLYSPYILLQMNVIAKGPKAWFIGVGIILLGIILVVIAFNLLILLLPIILIIMILSYLFRSLNKIKNKKGKTEKGYVDVKFKVKK